MARALDFTLGVLNGAIGDYLARTKNGLATPMECWLDGKPLPLEAAPLARAYPKATARVVVLVHGVMCTEQIWAFPDGSDYGSLLARDVGLTPVYVRYNSGLAIPDNGAALSRLLETLIATYPAPLEEIVLLGYSMGGLVARSACHVARTEGHAWLGRVRRAIYVGTPHLGAPMERVGRVVAKVLRAIDDPYTRLIGQIGDLRSDGLKDLGDADLRHEDRARRGTGLRLRDARHPVPLLPEIRHYLIAGSLLRDPQLALWFGDTMVPIASATDGACLDPAILALPPERVKIVEGAGHMPLAHHHEVYAHVRAWCEEVP